MFRKVWPFVAFTSLRGKDKATNDRQDRIDAIKKCVDVGSGCLNHLRHIAFYEASDRFLNKEASFETYWEMASTSIMFFGQENAVGGFPDEAKFRFKYTGSNDCYLTTAATFCTLKIERDVSNATDPIDVAHAV
jgi:hypothetical protein